MGHKPSNSINIKKILCITAVSAVALLSAGKALKAADDCVMTNDGAVCQSANSAGEVSPGQLQQRNSYGDASTDNGSTARSKGSSAVTSGSKAVAAPVNGIEIPSETVAGSAGDTIQQTIDDILANLDPEIEEGLRNAIASALTGWGEILKKRVEKGEITERDAAMMLRGLVGEMVAEANKIPETAEEVAEKTGDEDFTEETRELFIARFAQALMDDVAEAEQGNGFSTPTAGETGQYGGFNMDMSALANAKGDKMLTVVGVFGEEVTGHIVNDADKFVEPFKSKDGKRRPPDMKLLVMLDNIEAKAQKAGWNEVKFALTSGYRSPARNAAAYAKISKNRQGAKTSRHMQAQAADISLIGYRGKGRSERMEKFPLHKIACQETKEGGNGQVIKYVKKTTVHVASRGGTSCMTLNQSG